MRIIDPYNQNDAEKQLTGLMLKIANLSGYKRVMYDYISMDEEKRDAFEKSIDDHHLAESALTYIFLSRKYHGDHYLIPRIFEKLNRTEQGIFIGHYDALKNKAIEYGFLLEYETVREKIDTVPAKIINAAPWIILLFIVAQAPTTTNFLLLAMIFALDYMRTSTKTNLSIKQQNEIIIQKLDQEKIARSMAYSKQHLIDHGWIKDDDLDSIIKD